MIIYCLHVNEKHIWGGNFCRLPLRGKVAVREERERTGRILLRFLDSETNEGVIVKNRCRAQPDSFFSLLPHQSCMKGPNHTSNLGIPGPLGCKQWGKESRSQDMGLSWEN